MELSGKSDGERRGLTDAQKARVERNRQRALLLKQARLSVRPYTVQGLGGKGGNQVMDTGSGFFLEQEEKRQREISQQPGPVLPQGSDRLLCEECGGEFLESFLCNHFDLSVCDPCREREEEEEAKYSLITKTHAKKKFLLKDEDFDVREPVLAFLLRKNPHCPQWGEMKLFLHCQVRTRAYEVWGDAEGLEKARAERRVKREKMKKKKFDKRVRELRMTVRSSTWRKDTRGHEHDYGEELCLDDTEQYSKTCRTCGHVLIFEKM